MTHEFHRTDVSLRPMTVQLPNGWKIEVDVGPAKAVHVTAPDGRWIGILDHCTPRERFLAEFFRSMLDGRNLER